MKNLTLALMATLFAPLFAQATFHYQPGDRVCTEQHDTGTEYVFRRSLIWRGGVAMYELAEEEASGPMHCLPSRSNPTLLECSKSEYHPIDFASRITGLSEDQLIEMVLREELDTNSLEEIKIGRYKYFFALRNYSHVASYYAGFDFEESINNLGIADDITGQPLVICEKLRPLQDN